MTSTPPDAVLDAALGERAVADRRPIESRQSYGTYEVTVEDRDGPLVAKCTRVAGWRLRKEAAVLDFVAGVEGVPVPAVVASGSVEGPTDSNDDGADEWTYLLTTKCPGRTAHEVLRDDPDRLPALLRAVGRRLAWLHEGTTFPRPGTVVADARSGGVTLPEEPTTWVGVLAELVGAEAEILAGTAFEPCAERVLAVLEDHRGTVGGVSSPVLLHSDPNARNVLVADGGPSCLLDWEYAKAGDPAYDLVVAGTRFDGSDAVGGGDSTIEDGVVGAAGTEALRSGYREVRPLPDGFERRREVYRALLPVDRMVGLCGGSEAGDVDPAVAESEAGRRLRRLARQRVERLDGGS